MPAQLEEQSQYSQLKERVGQTKNEVFEVLGQQYSSYKQKLLEGIEESSVLLSTLIDEGAGTIKHILSGPNALKVVENQQAFVSALDIEDFVLLNVPKRSVHYEVKFVPKGSKLCWEFTLKSLDIDFSLKQRVKDDQDRIVHYKIIQKQRYGAGENIQGKWEADEDSTAVLEWDNSYSMLRSKSIACRIAIINL